MQAENITAWFSYSSAEHSLVSKICDYLKPDKVEAIVQLAIEPITKASEKAVTHGRIVPKCYRLDDGSQDDSPPVYRLAPGCSINELVYDIANNPLRIMVLSESYFKSPDCLNELCLSLSANHSSHKLPLLILSGFDNPSDVMQGTFEFADPHQSGQTKQQTLLQALTASHEVLRSKVDNWRGLDASCEFCTKLPELLKNYDKVLFLCAAEDNTEQLCVSIYRYFFAYLASVNLDSHEELVQRLYADWCEYEIAQMLLQKIAAADGEAQPKTDHFKQISTIDHARQFLNKVYKVLKKNRALLKTTQDRQIIYQLYGLVMLKSLKPIGASLLSALGRTDGLINVSVEDDTQLGLQNSLHATLTFCTATGRAPRMSIYADASSIDQHEMEGTVFARTQTILGISPSELYGALKALGAHLAPYDAAPKDDVLQDENSSEHKHYIECIRQGLKQMSDSEEYGLLVLSLSLHRGPDGYFPLLEKLDQLINKNDLDEKLSIPCVVLRAEHTPAGDWQTDLLFSDSAFNQFRRQFQDIAALYSTHAEKP